MPGAAALYDLMTQYEPLQESCLDAMRKADGIARIIQQREKARRHGEVPGGIADPEEPTDPA